MTYPDPFLPILRATLQKLPRSRFANRDVAARQDSLEQTVTITPGTFVDLFDWISTATLDAHTRPEDLPEELWHQAARHSDLRLPGAVRLWHAAPATSGVDALLARRGWGVRWARNILIVEAGPMPGMTLPPTWGQRDHPSGTAWRTAVQHQIHAPTHGPADLSPLLTTTMLLADELAPLSEDARVVACAAGASVSTNPHDVPTIIASAEAACR